jgi:hypothetical protein
MTDADSSRRIAELEGKLEELNRKVGGNSEISSKKEKSRKPRQPSEYNIFLKEHIAKEKVRLGKEYNHKLAFCSAGKKWTEIKSNSKSK